MTAALISGGMSLFGGILGGNSANKAAETQAKAQLDAAKIAAESARFKPVGVTTRFGSSNFEMGPDGNLVSAGYDVSPDVAAMRDSIMSQAGGQGMNFANQGLSQGQGMFNLGQQFMPQSTQYQADPNAMAYAAQLRSLGQQVMPQNYDSTAAAQQYMQQQQALLQPERDRMQATTTQNLFNSGRGGMAVAQGGGMGAANPEQQAMYNAFAQQDSSLAANAQAQARQQMEQDISLGTSLGNQAVSTGAAADQNGYNRMLSMLNTGSGLFSSGLNLANSSYAPFSTQFGLANTLENSGKDAMTMGANLGNYQMQGGTAGGNFIMQGAQNAGSAMQGAGGSAFGTGLTALGNNSAFTQGAADWWNGRPTDMTGFQQPYAAPTYQVSSPAPTTLGTGMWNAPSSSGSLGSGTWNLGGY